MAGNEKAKARITYRPGVNEYWLEVNVHDLWDVDPAHWAWKIDFATREVEEWVEDKVERYFNYEPGSLFTEKRLPDRPTPRARLADFQVGRDVGGWYLVVLWWESGLPLDQYPGGYRYIATRVDIEEDIYPF